MIKSPTAFVKYLQHQVDNDIDEIGDVCYGWTFSFDCVKDNTVNLKIEYEYTAELEIKFNTKYPKGFQVKIGEAFEYCGGEELISDLVLKYLEIEKNTEPILSLADQVTLIAGGQDFSWIKVKRFEPIENKDQQYNELLLHHQKETEFLIKTCQELARLYIDK